MGYIYKNKDYYNAINDYKNGDDSALKIELKFLSRRDIPEYDKDSFYFINEALKLAKKRKDKDTIVLLTELSRQMDSTGASNFMHSAVLTDSFENPGECLDALVECLKNGQYEVVLSNIVKFVRNRNYDLNTVRRVLYLIDYVKVIPTNELRKKALTYFIRKIDKMINEELRPYPYFYGIFGYGSSNKYFNEQSYKLYLSLAKKLSKKYGIVR